MTTDSGPRAKLDRLAEAMVKDLFETPDDELLAEVDPEGVMRTAEADLEAVRIRMGKERLAAAKAGVAADLPALRPRRRLDPKDARRHLSTAVSKAGGPDKITLAARSGDDIPDADLDGLIEDAEELGLDLGEEGDSGSGAS